MDAELEGERALHHLETAAPAAVLDQLLLVAAAAAPPLLAACPAGSFPPAASQLARSAKTLAMSIGRICMPSTPLALQLIASSVRHSIHFASRLSLA